YPPSLQPIAHIGALSDFPILPKWCSRFIPNPSWKRKVVVLPGTGAQSAREGAYEPGERTTKQERQCGPRGSATARGLGRCALLPLVCRHWLCRGSGIGGSQCS